MTEISNKINVEKPIPVEFDLGNLAVFDSNPIDIDNNDKKETDETEEILKKISRDNTQLIINQILSLPINSTNDRILLASLPEPIFNLPREKPIPKTKPLTKWEKFAKKKGITKKAKDGKLVYDEEKGQWVPKWGYKGKNKDIENQWLVEVNENKKSENSNSDDPRSWSRTERKLAVKKNLKQQERNIQRSSK